MSRKDSRSRRGPFRSAGILVLMLCCLVPSGYSEAGKGPRGERELALAIPPERFLPSPVLRPEWYQDTGSGGFPQDFSDELLLIDDEWERSPGGAASGSWLPHPENCVHWPC